MKIFLSYGHDQYEPLASRLKADLEAEGFEVWFDKDRLYGSKQWENMIESNIMNSQWLILMMTDHSVRRPDGVCLDEVSLARYKGKNILPIMVQNVQPPFCIIRIQWIDMLQTCINPDGSVNEGLYLPRLAEILPILKGEASPFMEGEQADLYNSLSPLDNDVYFNTFSKSYYGREWLYDVFQKWIDDPDSEKVMMMVGKAGVGKTSFVATLCSRSPNVVGIHFCKYNDSERSDPKRALMSLAYHLSTQLPGYREQIVSSGVLSKIDGLNIVSLFENLFTVPLSKVTSDQQLVLIIDALDEAEWNSGGGNLTDVISNNFMKTPKWLKLLVTTRPEKRIITRMSDFSPFIIENYGENNDDIRKYLEIQLRDIQHYNKDRMIAELSERSEGSFLFAQKAAECILDGTYSFDDPEGFPHNLSGIYMKNFDRFFMNNRDFYYDSVYPFLQVLVSSYEPVSIRIIGRITGMKSKELNNVKMSISSLFPSDGHYVHPLHKSVYDWLVDEDASGDYYISLEEGHEVIAQYMEDLISDGDVPPRVAKHIVRHEIDSGDHRKAAEYMMDQSVQEARIAEIGLTKMTDEYLYELSLLHKKSSKLSEKVMRSPYFIEFNRKYRAHMYYTSGYITMDKCGFQPIAEQTVLETSDADLLSAMGRYFYIIERFDKSQEIFKKVLDTIPEDDSYERCESLNLVGLCLRKYADFKQAEEYYRKCISCGDFRRLHSSTYMDLARMIYHLQRWDESFAYADKSIAKLQELIDADDEDPEDVYAAKVFMAELYRSKAECLMWHRGSLDEAVKYMTMAKDINEKYSNRNKNYPRLLYTDFFIRVISGEIITEKEFDDAFGCTSVSYDRSRIRFYQGLMYHLHGDSRAGPVLGEAFDISLKISSPLESAEICRLLVNYDPDRSISVNSDITAWTDYTESFFKSIQNDLSE